MKKLLLIAALFIWGHALAQNEKPSGADAILRIWETEEKDGRMQMLKKDNSYEGKMVYGKELFETDGRTYKKDVNNPDPGLRSRLLKDYTLISGLIYKDGKWVNGKIYSYRDGNSYDVNIELKNGLLYMRVYKGITMFGKTLKWHQVQ